MFLLFMTSKNPGYLASRNEFYGTPLQSSLKPHKSTAVPGKPGQMGSIATVLPAQSTSMCDAPLFVTGTCVTPCQFQNNQADKSPRLPDQRRSQYAVR